MRGTMNTDVFLSVGSTCSPEQESFVQAVEDRLRSEGIIAHTVGRNTFSVDQPLKTVVELMDKCSGTVVVALERSFFAEGIEKRGSKKESIVSNVKLPTPWNQIEAAMAHSRGHPLFVIVEEGIKSEGLLEKGYDWYVLWLKPTPAALTTAEFNGVLSSWKNKMATRPEQRKPNKSGADLTVAELIGSLKTGQLWSLLIGLSAIASGAFALGAKLFPLK